MKLFPYQAEGRKFLAGRRRALLADTMGLGKTAQAITAADDTTAETILIVCPASVCINWQREFKKFSAVLRSYKFLDNGAAKPMEGAVNIVSYDLASRKPLLARLESVKWDLLILDEAHYLKNRAAKRTVAIYGTHCKGENGLISKAVCAWALTGTPTPNHPGEIYPLLRAFGVWKENYFAFEEKFCETKMGDYGPVVIGMKKEAMPKLKAMVKPIMLRRKKEDVLKDLPPITYSDVVVPWDGVTNPDDAKEWLDAEKDAEKLRTLVKKMTGGITDPEAIIAAEKELAAMHMPTLRRLTGMAKIRPVYELVSRELDAGLEKVVIFCIHRDVIMGLRDSLTRYGALTVFGGMDAAKKQERIDKFRDLWKHRVFIGQVQSAGTGIDGLQTSCNNVLFVESSWNPADNAQAAMRVHRIGQKKPVLCRFVSLADSLDEAVQTVIRRKTEMVSQLLD